MIQQTLHALLADRNVPQDVAEAVCERLLDGFSNALDQPSAASYSWRSFLEGDFGRYQLVGPRIPELPRSVRITRIVGFSTFHQYHLMRPKTIVKQVLPISGGVHAEEFDNYISTHGIGNNLTDTWSGICWTFLDEELRSSPLREVESGLGLYHLGPGTVLVAITYTIDSAQLHVPTVIDAGLQPGFVSKVASDIDMPRAWDWAHGQWGLCEMVHRSGVAPRDPEVRLLGKTSQSFLPAYEGLSSFTPPQSVALENVVAQALRKALAHRDLQPFLSGATSMLEITPSQFEHFIASLYARQGYETTVTRASRDGGFDIIGLLDRSRNNGLLIQAKQTRGVVGIRVIRELVGARFLADDNYAPYMLVVATTGRFSKPAQEAQAQHSTHIQLQDYESLQRQLRTINSIGLVDIVREAVTAARSAG